MDTTFTTSLHCASRIRFIPVIPESDVDVDGAKVRTLPEFDDTTTSHIAAMKLPNEYFVATAVCEEELRKGQIGEDSACFWIQSLQTGSRIKVDFRPTTASPCLDRVNMTFMR